MTLVLEDIHPVARKEHQCNICWGTIAVGDRYHRQRNIWDGEANTFKAHELCSAAWTKAHHDLELWDDETPDWDEDIKPLVEGALRLLGPRKSREL